MANVSAVQLLRAAKFVLSIAAGGFLLVCQWPMDFPNFVAAMYVLVLAAILLLYFSLGRPQLGSTVATTAVGFWSATIPDLVSLSVTDSDQIPSSSLGFQLTDCSTLPTTTVDGFRSTTGGILLVCQRPTDFRSFVAAMYLMMTLGFLLLYLTLARPHLGSTTATTAADDSCVPTEQLLKVAKFVLAIATGGFLLVCQSPMDYPSYAMTMYLLMTLGFPSAKPFHVSFTDGTDNDLRWFPMSQQLLFLHALLFPLTPSVIDE
ncbi:unnamed protein product [Musa acuminata subsp. malaccensis]|uniref:(wild Malaysian banana) hypothetical protein n=1 Tax=Musa acuminata subsp. malaccensis TaxID=214687 RepID=A0A804JXL6_MUSAM|nr:unnamed protein product [Musa acuminata subsp. malaccensis]